ncbi:signal peptidase II [Mucilaginibacter glaciei]|uniref:Lipoprotein signal peptidase n=1 Tax=Mucilaginibacter glaciei TaxID=2772109 RepID=A0A926NR16_9SPHI|nr:signal peptidase II [Mucilaginibacter glaciei]MBD1393140.1 signal peptidase II [Mucilaginibacter glaciei]
MNRKGIIRTIMILAILAITIACDQISKSIIRARLDVYDHYNFLNHHFNVFKVENTGAFLSLGNNLPDPFHFILLTLLPVLALLGGLVYIIIKQDITRLTLIGIIFVIGGGMGNLYDRIAHGSVTDFMHIDFGVFETGIFNVADVSIMIGIGLIFLDGFVKNKEVKEQEILASE